MKKYVIITLVRTMGFTALALLLVLTAATNASATIVDTETKLVPSPGARDLQFAVDVAINNNTAAVGALQAFHGSVFIYTLVGTNWTQTQILTTGLSVFESFGRAVALEDNVLAVGQPSALLTNPAAVYIYNNIGGTWSLQQTLVEPNPVVPNGFGSALDISGQMLAVGNPFESTDINTSGAVYVYAQSGNTWLLQAKLKANDPSNSALLGTSVAIDGNTVLAGTVVGAAYVFTGSGTNWTQQQKLEAPPGEPSPGFGASVALEGDVAVVTGQQTIDNTNSGAVYVFTRTGTTWTVQQILSLPGSETNFVFGDTVAIHNGKIAVGVPGATVDGLSTAGTVVIYQFNGTSWEFVQQVAATDPQSGAILGASVDVGDAGIIAGAPGVVDVGRAGQGAAYIFSLSGTNTPVTLSASASPNVLFPPNHKLVPVTITVVNHENFASCRIVSVTSNEPVTGKGKNSADWIITGDLTLLLRAERTGQARNGRIYTITVECVDNSGNTSQVTVTVTVPHDAKHRSIKLRGLPALNAPAASRR